MEQILREYLTAAPHGAATEICENTELTKSVLSNWMNRRGALTKDKIVQAIDWLIESGKITVTTHV